MRSRGERKSVPNLWTVVVALLRAKADADAGRRDGDTTSKSLSLSVTEHSAVSGRLAGGMLNPNSDAFRLLLIADNSPSLSGSDTTSARVVCGILG